MDVPIARVFAFLLMLGTLAIVVRIGCLGMDAERDPYGADGTSGGSGAGDPWALPSGTGPSDGLASPGAIPSPATAPRSGPHERLLERIEKKLESIDDPARTFRSRLDDGTLDRLGEASRLIESSDRLIDDPEVRRRASEILQRVADPPPPSLPPTPRR